MQYTDHTLVNGRSMVNVQVTKFLTTDIVFSPQGGRQLCATVQAGRVMNLGLQGDSDAATALHNLFHDDPDGMVLFWQTLRDEFQSQAQSADHST